MAKAKQINVSGPCPKTKGGLHCEREIGHRGHHKFRAANGTRSARSVPTTNGTTPPIDPRLREIADRLVVELHSIVIEMASDLARGIVTARMSKILDAARD